MTQALLIQGSWEELSARAEEFKHRQDLMLIVPGDTETKNAVVPKSVSLAEVLKGRTGLVSFEPSDLSEDTGKKFADLLAEQHQEKRP